MDCPFPYLVINTPLALSCLSYKNELHHLEFKIIIIRKTLIDAVSTVSPSEEQICIALIYIVNISQLIFQIKTFVIVAEIRCRLVRRARWIVVCSQTCDLIEFRTGIVAPTPRMHYNAYIRVKGHFTCDQTLCRSDKGRFNK